MRRKATDGTWCRDAGRATPSERTRRCKTRRGRGVRRMIVVSHPGAVKPDRRIAPARPAAAGHTGLETNRIAGAVARLGKDHETIAPRRADRIRASEQRAAPALGAVPHTSEKALLVVPIDILVGLEKVHHAAVVDLDRAPARCGRRYMSGYPRRSACGDRRNVLRPSVSHGRAYRSTAALHSRRRPRAHADCRPYVSATRATHPRHAPRHSCPCRAQAKHRKHHMSRHSGSAYRASAAPRRPAHAYRRP